MTVLVLLCLLIVVSLAGTMLQAAVRARRQLQTERDFRQTELLLQAGLERAAYRLAAEPDYRGETWEPASQASAGQGRIAIQTTPSSVSGPWQVNVVAEFPHWQSALDSPLPHVCNTLRLTPELRINDHDSLTIEGNRPSRPGPRGLHPGRTAGGDRHHRRADFAAAAGRQCRREAAQRAQCMNNITQTGLAVHNYEFHWEALPSGSINPEGPIRNVAEGIQVSWIVQILPYFEQNGLARHFDNKAGAYAAVNAKVRGSQLPSLVCPSDPMPFIEDGVARSSYAGCYNDAEAPINTDNHGLLYLNSKVRYEDIYDGARTPFCWEKLWGQRMT